MPFNRNLENPMKNLKLYLLVLFCAATALPAQTATFTSSVIADKNKNVLDAGFYHLTGDTVMHQYLENDGPDQLWTYGTNGQICTAGTKLCLAQSGTTLIQAAVGDVFIVAQSGTGYTIKSATGSYINPANCTSTCSMPLSATAYVWAIPKAVTTTANTTAPLANTCASGPTLNYATDGTIDVHIPAGCALIQPGGSWGFVQIGRYRIEFFGDPSLTMFQNTQGTNGAVPQGALIKSILPAQTNSYTGNSNGLIVTAAVPNAPPSR
jgi:hypothetical protein